MAEISIQPQDEIEHIGRAARQASREMARAVSGTKNAFLAKLGELINAERPAIMEANARDMEEARKAGRDEAFLDRLALQVVELQSTGKACHGVSQVDDFREPVRCSVCICTSLFVA